MKYLALKNLDNLQLATSLHFKSLKLTNLIFEIVDDVAFLQKLCVVESRVEFCCFLFFFCCWYEHGLVWAVNFELNRHLGSCVVL